MRKVSVKGSLPFILTIAALSFPLSGVFDTSTIVLNQMPWYLGALVVILIIFIGALFDMLGVSAAAATEPPFHAMAAKRVFGAKRAIQVVRNAEKVSSVCSDVIGDIAGVLSGAGALAVSVQLGDELGIAGWQRELVIILMTALVTALTVGAKAIGKTLAISSPTPIILTACKILDSLILLPKRIRGTRRSGRT